MSNKIKYGLKNVYYAIVTVIGNNVTYGTPESIPGAVSLALSQRGDKAEFYADDIEYFGTTTNQGYEGTLEIALIPDKFRIDVLKEELDSNGVLIENSEAMPKNIALLFEFSGDTKKTRHVLYNVAVSRPNVESETKGAQITPKTDTLNITANPAIDTKDVKAKVEQGQAPYDTFFNNVYIKNSAINTVDLTEVEFDNANKDDITLVATSTAVTNSIKNVKLNGLLIPGIYLSVNELEIVIDQAYLDTLDLGNYTILVELEKGNAINVALEVK